MAHLTLKNIKTLAIQDAEVLNAIVRGSRGVGIMELQSNDKSIQAAHRKTKLEKKRMNKRGK